MWTKPLQHCNLPDSQDLGYDDIPLTNTVAKTTGHSTRGSRQWWRLNTNMIPAGLFFMCA
jgi:hypothetical protein